MTDSPLKPTAGNVTRILKNADVAVGSPYAGLSAGGRTPGEVIVDVETPIGARRATDEQVDRWFTTASAALAERGLHLERTHPRVAVVTAKRTAR